jgi:hypothetical protein
MRTTDTKAVELSAPIDLGTVKDDLGIPPGDTSNDAWLQRRIDGIWSRFQSYTARPLTLASGWVDDWGELIQSAPARNEPPLISAHASASVFLRVFPVQQIIKLTLNGTEQNVARVIFDRGDGKLIGLDGYACDLRRALVYGRARVEYVAGYDELPPDLYEAMIGTLTPLWTARQASQSGGMPGVPTRINAIDVGEIELSSAANAFVDATLKGVRTTDPLLGPYTALLDPYIDWRSMIGGAYPMTVALDTSEAADAQPG